MNRALVMRAASHLLTYPDDSFWTRLPLIREAAPSFTGFLDEAERLGARRLAAHYVETFDLRRRCCLYLTYFTDGDTRRRGDSLARLKTRYRLAGWELTDELPDFLPVMLEFAALDPAGETLLREHRPALELLDRALTEHGSPYASVLGRVRDLLPPITDAERGTAAKLAMSGPPAESVGVHE